MICVSINEKNFEKCLGLAKEFEMCEIRIDLCGLNLEQTQKIFSTGNRLIATCRPEIVTDAVLRASLLKTAIKAGARFVDIEFESDMAFKQEIISATKGTPCETIISYHNYETTPCANELRIITEQCFDMGAGIAKIACMVNHPADNASIFSLYQPGKRIVALGMGPLGKISRIAAPLLGAEFTFASESDETATAPGQISYKKMKEILNLIS